MPVYQRSSFINNISLFAILGLNLFFHQAYSQDTYKNEFGFQSDNDAYLAVGQDRYYTNGLFITFRHAVDQTKLRKPIKKIWEAEFGHKMYNPISGSISNIEDVDRPFAAYLYIGGGLTWLFQTENSLKLSVQAGTIGPAAKGREVQETLHDLVGFYPIKGWEYQVNNEAGLNASLSYHHFLHRNERGNTDFTLTSYLNAGNTFSGAGAGILFRTGRINPLFNSVTTQSRIAHSAEQAQSGCKELFLYLKPAVHLVAYDATIRGGMFAEDKGPVTYDAKPVVFSQEAGINYANNRWTLNFGVTFNSKELKSTAKAHQYGSAAIYYRFN